MLDGVTRPLLVTAPAGDPRLFVVGQDGVITVVGSDGVPLAEPFLDLRGVVTNGGIEQGMLGMAFHPGFAENGRFVVSYTDTAGDSHIDEYRASPPDAGEADPASRREILTVAQPTDRHNGGMVLFGPDGYLWAAFGEGGAASEHAQDPTTLLSSIIRIDVDAEPYRIPADNPFAGGGGAAEVWAYGLRNPWRFAIDGPSGLIYIGDVGHSDWEEIDVVPLDGAPYNFGWLIKEGTHCFAGPCDTPGLVDPVVEYSHSEGCSVTGGVVYRGADIPELTGHYFYGDWCGGWVRSFRFDGDRPVEARDWSDELGRAGQITSFGTDGLGEMYVTTWEGTVFRIESAR